MFKRIALVLLPLYLLTLSGCAVCLAGALGGVVGYEAKEHGYKVRNPVYKGHDSSSSREK
jgi:hypothetical protein